MFVRFQKLCDLVSELLLEESNVQPVTTPVTVCGDIHGQVRKQRSAIKRLQFRKSQPFSALTFNKFVLVTQNLVGVPQTPLSPVDISLGQNETSRILSYIAPFFREHTQDKLLGRFPNRR